MANRLSTLVGKLYEASVDESLWRGVAVDFANAFNSSSTVIKTYGASGELSLLETTENMVVAPKDAAWADHWHHHDLWVEKTMGVGPDQIVVGHRLIEPAELERTSFYNDWLRALQIYHVVGGMFMLGDGAVGVLGVHRDQGDRFYSPADERATAIVMPHLQRALWIRNRLGAAAMQHSAAALELSSWAVLVVAGPRRRVLYASPSAERFLARTRALRVVNGYLAAEEPASERRLAHVVADALATAAGGLRLAGRPIRLPRAEGAPFIVVAAPLPDEARLAIGQPAALVFIRDPDVIVPPASHLRQAFGLTEAEAKIAAELCRGASPSEIAARADIGVSTVRSHLKAIMLKTETSRQSELVALLLRSLG